MLDKGVIDHCYCRVSNPGGRRSEQPLLPMTASTTKPLPGRNPTQPGQLLRLLQGLIERTASTLQLVEKTLSNS